MSISVHRGSILDSKADFIVNPANLFLRHGAGLAKIIANAATAFPPGMHAGESAAQATAWNREQAQTPNIATGNVALTSAGALPYMGIIHAVGPVWEDGSYFEHELLHRVHCRAIEVAEENGGRRIAFPAISCGLFRFPVEVAAPIAVRAARARDLHVEFWPFGLEEAYEDALRDYDA